MPPATDTDILIVGAGPVGLFLANECARRGLRARLIEARAAQSEHSKALAIMPRTLEIFDMAGVAAPFLALANRVTAIAVLAHGRTLAHMNFAPRQTPYPFVAMVPQDQTERLLVEELRRQGGSVEYQTCLLAAEDRGDMVAATLERNGERSRLTAAYLVGCDGAHSAVRHWLNLPFVGAQYEATFLLADVHTNEAWPAAEMELCSSERGPLAVFPMSATRRRIVATVSRADGEAPPLALVQALLAERGPQGMAATALHWSAYFHIHHRQTERLRVGRVFIAGDAAHIHSPFGGQGMNTGLQDAWNLAWKLAFALCGHGNESLLASYEQERRAVIRQVVDTTDFLTRAMGTPNKLAQTLRDAVIPMVSRLAPFQHAFVQRLSELGVAYDGSPIVEGPGQRYFDDSLRGGQGILGRYLLCLGDDVGAGLRDAARQLCEAMPHVVELRAVRARGLTLVRPDGYIAYAAAGRADAGAVAAARSLLQRHTC